MSVEVYKAIGMESGNKNEKREKRKSDREKRIEELEQRWDRKEESGLGALQGEGNVT